MMPWKRSNPGALLVRRLCAQWKYGGMFSPSKFFWDEKCGYCPFKLAFISNQDIYPTTESFFQTLGTKFCQKSSDPFDTTCHFPMALCKAFICLVGVYFDENSKPVPVVIVGNMLSHEILVIKVLGGFNHEQVDLIHMRVDDNENFKLLIVSSSSSGPGNESLVCADEYDSEQKRWAVQQENLSTPKKNQSGASCRNSNDEEVLLFIDIDNRVCQFNYERKAWSSCNVPEVTFSDATPAECQNASIQDYGGRVILFSEYICGQDGYVTIHILSDLSPDGVATWEESKKSRKKRSGEKRDFWVFSSIQEANGATEEQISNTGGCVYVITADDKFLCISKYDRSVGKKLQWGPEERFQIPKPTVRRVQNYTDEVSQALLLLYVEFLQNKNPDKIFSHWEYIATGLWEWRAIDRWPNSCQGRWDSLRKLFNASSPLKPEIENLMMKICELKATSPKRARRSVPPLNSGDSTPNTSGGPAPSAYTAQTSSTTLSAAVGTYQPAQVPGTSYAVALRMARPITPNNDPAGVVELLKNDGASSQHHVSAYQRASDAIEVEGRKLSEKQSCTLYCILSRFDRLREAHRIEASNSRGKPLSMTSKFEEGINFLQSHRDLDQLSVDDRFALLMENIETDILKHM